MACPVCKEEEPGIFEAEVRLGPSRPHALVRCRGCGVLRFDPLPGPEELDAFYCASYYDFDRGGETGRGKAFAKRLSRLAPRGRILDVGCAQGFFIDGIRRACDWEVYGVDFGRSAVEFAREELGLDVRSGSVAEAGYPDGFFDYIRVNNVLEHVTDPMGLLAECRRIIKPTGTLQLSVPNGDNDSRTLVDFHLTEKAAANSYKGHIFFFPSSTIRRMVAEAGFEIRSARSYGLKRGLRNAGVLPRKRGWKELHRRAGSEGQRQGSDAGRAVRSDLYYRWRSEIDRLKMFPGLRKYFLDYLLIMVPAERR